MPVAPLRIRLPFRSASIFQQFHPERFCDGFRVRARRTIEELPGLLGDLQALNVVGRELTKPVTLAVFLRSIFNGVFALVCFYLLMGAGYRLLLRLYSATISLLSGVPEVLSPDLKAVIDVGCILLLIVFIAVTCSLNHTRLRDFFPRRGLLIQLLYVPLMLILIVGFMSRNSSLSPQSVLDKIYLLLVVVFYSASVLFGISQFLESIIVRAKLFAIMRNAEDVDVASYVRHVRTGIEELGAVVRQRLAVLGDFKTLLCRNCLTRLDEFDQQLELIYPRCRCCGTIPLDAASVRRVPEVVATLNQQAVGEFAERDGVLYINWCRHRSLFDYDRVYVQAADDHEVERFMMAIINDTDPRRRGHAAEVSCVVNPACRLSKHTLNMLRNTFAWVTEDVNL